MNQTYPVIWEDVKSKIPMSLTDDELKRLSDLKLSIEDNQRCFPHIYFLPNGKQSEFIKSTPADYSNQEIITKVFSAGNSTGKTAIAIMSVCSLVTSPDKMNHIYKDLPYWYNFKRPNIGRIVSDATAIKEKIIPELKKWLPAGTYYTEKGRKDYESIWHFPETKCHFTIMTNDQDVKEFESVELDWCLFDEPTTRDIYTATITRLRFGGLIMFTLTPLIDAGWMDDAIVNKTNNKTSFIVYAEMEDNCKLHGINGILDHKIIEKIISELDPLEYDARVKGKSIHYAGLRYPTFDRNIHISKPPDNYKSKLNSSYIIVNVLDPHDRKPFALGWYLVSLVEPYKCYAIAEYPTEPFERIRVDIKSITEYVDIIKSIEKDIGDPYLRYIDPNYGNRHTRQTEAIPRSIKDDLQDYGLYYYDVSDSLEIGHRRVQEMLKYTDDIAPRLSFAPNLYNHIYALTHYRHGNIDPLTSKEKINEDGKDFADLIRYLAVSDAWLYNPQSKYKQFEFKGRRNGY